MYDAFAKIDGGGSGRDAGDDLRIEMDEWMKGYKGVTNHGFVALDNLREISRKEAKVIFNEKIDDNGGGIVLLDEWCEFIKKAEVEAGTRVGGLLSMDESGGFGENHKLSVPAKILGKNVEGKKGSSSISNDLASPKRRIRPVKNEQTVKDLIDVSPEIISNSFGLRFCTGESGVSESFIKFQAAFEPLCAETSEGEKLREEGFLDADPNGNGLCSLAELETFVLKLLVKKYHRVGTGYSMEEPGKDLFKDFRPCYMRAFVDAKDYKADTGEVIVGTEDATGDDFVSIKTAFIYFFVTYTKLLLFFVFCL
jgi:hypothetical protein